MLQWFDYSIVYAARPRSPSYFMLLIIAAWYSNKDISGSF